MPIGPLGLILIGILYLLKPDVFRNGLFKRPPGPPKTFADHNVNYMRLLGSICIIAGVFLLYRLHH